MGIGLAFEGYEQVGAKQTAAAEGMPRLDETEQPFQRIEEEEGEVEEFALLASVDTLVTKICCGEGTSLTDKDEAADVEGCEASKGQKTVEDDQSVVRGLRGCRGRGVRVGKNAIGPYGVKRSCSFLILTRVGRCS